MAKRPTITTITSGYNSTAQLNANLVALRNAFDNTLSLDGSTPNAMGADLDMNNNNILNLNELEVAELTIGGNSVAASVAAAAASAAAASVSETNAAASEAAAAASASIIDPSTYLVRASNLSDVPDASAALINLGLTATASELNTLDGVTATAAELNFVDGVTSNIQTQIDAKLDTADLAAVTADIVPDADSTRDLGSASAAWALAYLDAIEPVGTDTTIKRVGGTNTTPIVEGIAKTWVNFNGTGAIAARDSLNVSSLTDNGTGTYTINTTSAFSTVNFLALATQENNTSNSDTSIYDTFASRTTSSARIQALQAAAVTDVANANVVLFGDLA